MSVQPGGSILHTAIWRRSIRLFTSYKHHEEWASVNDLFTSYLSSKDTVENASWKQKSNDSSPVVFVTRTATAECDGKGEERGAQDFPVASTPRFPSSHQTLRATKFGVNEYFCPSWNANRKRNTKPHQLSPKAWWEGPFEQLLRMANVVHPAPAEALHFLSPCRQLRPVCVQNGPKINSEKSVAGAIKKDCTSNYGTKMI